MAAVRVGVVGAGVMGRAHLEVLRTSVAGVRVVAVSDPDGRRTEAIAGPGLTMFADPLALIASSDVDAVVVASPDEAHESQVAACIDAGKPVLCEKPLSPSSDSCRKLAEREQARGRRLVQIGFMRRFDPAYLDLKARYDAGSVGRALILRCWHRNAVAPGFFRSDMTVSNAMVHEFDIARWLLNSEIARIRIDSPSLAGAPLTDPILATLAMTTGELVSIEVFMNANYGYDIRTELVGESGVLVMGTPAATACLSKTAPGTRFSPDFRVRFRAAYARQMQAWVEWILGGVPAGASTIDGLRATLAAEAGEKALESNQWESVAA